MTTTTETTGRTDRHLLTRLTQTGLAIAAGDEDVRGRVARDRDGRALGRIDDLLVDATHRRARYLRIRSGGFFGVGSEVSYLPVRAVVAVDGRGVIVDSAPMTEDDTAAYDPRLIREPFLSADDGPRDYGAYWPYWTAGYPYPRRSERDRY